MENGFSVNNNTYGQDAGALLQPKLSGVKKKTSEQKTDFKSVYAGELLNRGDRVSDRYALAQKRALRKILNQFEEDSKIDAETEGRSERVEVLKTNIAGNNHNLIDLDERREALKEYMTEEPTEQELTDYQQAMLMNDEYNDEEREYRRRIHQDQSEVVYQTAVNKATEQALLKSHPMLDAVKEADAIMENATKNLISDLFDEGIDKMEEDKKETQEEIAENKAEALEEKIELEKEKAEKEQKKEELDKEIEEAILSTVLQAVNYGSRTAVANLQSNVKSLIQDQVFLDVDLKGLKIDTEL